MNTRKKGNSVQRKAYDLLKDEYYIQFNGHTRFGNRNNYSNTQSKDMFGLFDAILVKKTGGDIIFLQVSANRQHTLEPYREWIAKTGLPVMLLCWKDRKGFVGKKLVLGLNGIAIEMDMDFGNTEKEVVDVWK